MKSPEIGDFRFTPEDQWRFARFSGDYNPLHTDAVFCRRTQFGYCAVHGVHLLLSSLDWAYQTKLVDFRIGFVRARFLRPVMVDDRCEFRGRQRPGQRLVVEVHSEGARCAIIEVRAQADAGTAQLETFTIPTKAFDTTTTRVPRVLGLSDLAEQQGGFAPGPKVDEFPALSSFMGKVVVGGIAELSRIVGMLTPGLHSIFGSLQVNLTNEDDDILMYRTAEVDERFRRAVIEVRGARLQGVIEAYLRHPPVEQLGIDEVRRLVDIDEFGGTRALIIGGSRGLGAVTAKLLASGGADVMITYARGRADAEIVCQEIGARGGRCQIRSYDIASNPDEAFLDPSWPSHLFYFATPPIFLPKTEDIATSEKRLALYTGYYISGFMRLINWLSTGQQSCRVLYPSSIAVQITPDGLCEYAMAKAAGETYCRIVHERHPLIDILVPRLDRLITDQTTGPMTDLGETSLHDVPATLLPLIRRLHNFAPISPIPFIGNSNDL